MQSLDFWIEYGSTYTYLTVARIGKLASEVGVRVRWEPFFVMPIMADLGMIDHESEELSTRGRALLDRLGGPDNA